jgi:putative ABC transport system substrate-binding protein
VRGWLVAAFNRGLNEAGFVEGQNITIEYRWADGHADRLPALAEDLVRRRVTVIAGTGGGHAAAKQATSTIPIVASIGGDAVKLGLVASINRPGGNFTGVAVFTSDLEAKRLELLSEIVPPGAVIGVIIDPEFDAANLQRQVIQAAAQAIGRKIIIVGASTESALDKAFSSLVEARVGALVVVGNPLFLGVRARLLELTARYRLAAIYESREFTAAGGLMSYGTNLPDVYRQVGVYVGRILKGEKPADLPILQPTKFDMAINLKTAKTLGIDVPTSILLRADEVIE